jgi:hypothetical protein
MFRHPLTVEFESTIQEQILKGTPPSGADVSAIYFALLKQYFGDGKDDITVDNRFATEWASVRLPFGSFETINWPFAMASACSLVERVRAGDPIARKGFDGVLGRGESDLSYDLLKQAGGPTAESAAPKAVIIAYTQLEIRGLKSSSGCSRSTNFQKHFPKANFVREQRFVRGDDVTYTAGDLTSGMDLALHIVEECYGQVADHAVCGRRLKTKAVLLVFGWPVSGSILQ